LAIGALVGVVLAATACGGGGCSSSDGGPALSKDDFISQADAICQAHVLEFQSEVATRFPQVDPTSETATEGDLRAFEEPLAATEELRARQLDELRALAPPEDFEDTWDEILGHLEDSVAALGEAAEAAGNADRDALGEAFEQGEEAGDAADEAAGDYGFEVCGQT
jgi:hypothetical protein